MGNFEESIKKEFCFIFDDHDFEFIKNIPTKEALPFFAVAIVQGDGLRLRFIKDRADFFVDVGSSKKPQEWISIYKMLSWLKLNGYVKEEIKSLNSSKAISRILEKYFDLIKTNIDIINK